MKGQVAIQNTINKLEKEFNERKAVKIQNLEKSLEEVNNKIAKLQKQSTELQTALNKLRTTSFEVPPHLTKEKREAQRKESKGE